MFLDTGQRASRRRRRCWAARRLYGSGVRVVADPRIAGSIRLHATGAQNLSAFPPGARTTFLAARAEAYDPAVHGRPGQTHFCGPWRPANR